MPLSGSFLFLLEKSSLIISVLSDESVFAIKAKEKAKLRQHEQRTENGKVKGENGKWKLASLLFTLCSVILPFGARTANAGKGKRRKRSFVSVSSGRQTK